MGSILGAMLALDVRQGDAAAAVHPLIKRARTGSIVPGQAGEGAVDHVTDRLPRIAVELHQPHLLDGTEIRRPVLIAMPGSRIELR